MGLSPGKIPRTDDMKHRIDHSWVLVATISSEDGVRFMLKGTDVQELHCGRLPASTPQEKA
jgi:hypothetical protein